PINQSPSGALANQSSLNSAPIAGPSNINTPQTATIQGLPVKADKTIKRVAAECIIRAVIRILSRGFPYISLELFKVLYSEAFDCPDIDGSTLKNGRIILENRMLKGLIATHTKDNKKYYALNYDRFQKIAEASNIRIPRRTKIRCFDLPNAANLPLTQMLAPVIVQGAVEVVKASLYNIADQYPSLIPTTLEGFPELKDLERYLPLWHPDLAKFSTVRAGTSTQHTRVENTPLLSPKEFERLSKLATERGMAAKRARKLLNHHSTYVMQPVEKERQEELEETILISRTDLTSQPIIISSPSPSCAASVEESLMDQNDDRDVLEQEGGLQSISRANQTLDQPPILSQSPVQKQPQPLSTPQPQPQPQPHHGPTHGINQSQKSMSHAPVSETQTLRFQPYARMPGGAGPSKPIGNAAKEEARLNTPVVSTVVDKHRGGVPTTLSTTFSKTLDGHRKVFTSSVSPLSKRRDIRSLGYIPPSGKGVFTLPRPMLPPFLLDDEDEACVSQDPHVDSARNANLPTADGQELNREHMHDLNDDKQGLSMIVDGHPSRQYLQRNEKMVAVTRDQILRSRREAFEKIVEYLWTVPMGCGDASANENGSSSSSTANTTSGTSTQ
ncbi:hypothetical protein BGW38_006894, partial [Lunasporangiospora selenospora]